MTDDAYSKTLNRIEPEIAMVDPGTFAASAAVSLKRIADALERLEPMAERMNDLLSAIEMSVRAGPR